MSTDDLFSKEAVTSNENSTHATSEDHSSNVNYAVVGELRSAEELELMYKFLGISSTHHSKMNTRK